MTFLVSFPERLKTYRKSMGWTQGELAAKWVYSSETISAWERGKRTPNTQEIPRVANLFRNNFRRVDSVSEYNPQ